MPDCYICLNRTGRPSGEAYVGFNSMDDFQFGKSKDRQNMGSSRFIEVFESSIGDMEREMSDYGKSDYVVKMRGLPNSAGEQDIRDFFQG